MRYIIFLMSILICQELHANDLDIIQTAGYASFDIGQDYRPSYSSTTSESSFAIGALVTYKVYSDLIIGAAVNTYIGWSSLGVDDGANVDDTNYLIGYSIDAGNGFSVVPLIGMSYWKFQFTQGALSNSGQKDTFNYGGHNPVYRILLKFPSKRLVGFNIGYTYGKNDFGTLQSVNFELRYQLMRKPEK